MSIIPSLWYSNNCDDGLSCVVLWLFLADWKPWPYSGQIRLVGGITASEGLVEIYLHGEWGRVCTSSDEIAGEEANVICRQLGYDSAVSFTPKLVHFYNTCYVMPIIRCEKTKHVDRRYNKNVYVFSQCIIVRIFDNYKVSEQNCCKYFSHIQYSF